MDEYEYHARQARRLTILVGALLVAWVGLVVSL